MGETIVIVRTDNGRTYAKRIAKELNDLGLTSSIISWREVEEVCRDEVWSSSNTVLHFRAAGPNVNAIAAKFEQQRFRIVNSAKVLQRTSDKYHSYEWAGSKGVTLPQTIKGEREVLLKSIPSLSFHEFVLKPINSKHQGALCFRSHKDDGELAEKMSQVPGEEIILQEFVEYTKIYRVIVINGKPLADAVFLDEVQPDRWKVSVCLNPEIQHVPNPDSDLLAYATMIADVFESEVAFVDVFETEQGYVLSEVNTACNLSRHEDRSGYPISKRIAEHLAEKVRNVE